ncbi:SH3 domain-containing protein [Streptomyces sp. NPDC007076]|uniref:SH3 domain-containing protein n=1 Tax=Streptomyces pulveraceus TaxID=68258 RepID=A0ABW1GWU2_9ACTN|nr:SH3 domain-containing protein [Streptomyces sp. JV190]MEE1845578.1 SH3 domain-containing protein [Streptomyces sp. JV190]
MMKKMMLAAMVLTAGLGLAVSPAAQAAQSPAAVQALKAPAAVCTVNDNGVNFRGGPGTDYPVLGTVNRGQNLNYRGQQGNWIMGDLWGGPTGVWIHVAYLDC